MQTRILRRKKEFFVFPTAPFHFDGTFHKPSHFPDKLDDWENGKYWQAIRIDNKLFGLKIENKGKTQKPKTEALEIQNGNSSITSLPKFMVVTVQLA